jgi:uncharacterized lipoprotein YajG
MEKMMLLSSVALLVNIMLTGCSESSLFMKPKLTAEPWCQSCGMPLDDLKLLGTNQDGSQNKEYCCYCYQKGAFVNPNITMKQMIEKMIPIVVSHSALSEPKAREVVTNFISTLKRWK